MGKSRYRKLINPERMSDKDWGDWKDRQLYASEEQIYWQGELDYIADRAKKYAGILGWEELQELHTRYLRSVKAERKENQSLSIAKFKPPQPRIHNATKEQVINALHKASLKSRRKEPV